MLRRLLLCIALLLCPARLLAAPMAVMYVVAEVICRRADKAKKKRLSSNEFAVSLDS